MNSIVGAPKDIDEYIAGFPHEVQEILKQMRATIRRVAPDAEEAIKYQIPTFVLNGNLVHFAAFQNHIGFYPSPSGIEAFQGELAAYKSAKGSIQFPLDQPLPWRLIEEIVTFRVKEAHAKMTLKKKINRRNGMASSSGLSVILFAIYVFTFLASPCRAEISVGILTKEKAKEKYGITMHARKNGDAGIKVWLEFKKKGWLEKFTYAELQMEGAQGKQVVSAQLQPNPVHHRQPEGVTTVAFSADASQLSQCRFLVVCYGRNEGDVGYYLNVKDFLDLTNPPTEE